MSMAALRSGPYSSGSMGQWHPSPATAPTTATTSTPRSQPVILMRPLSYHPVRARCRATWPRLPRRSATGISDALLSAAAWAGRGRGIRLACSGGGRYRALEMRHWRRAALADGGATSDRGSHRHLDGVDAPRRHRCAKVVVLSNHHRGGVHGPG